MKIERFGRLTPGRLEREDGGQALLGYAYYNTKELATEEETGEVWFRVTSWSESKIHTEIAPFMGKTIKITMEIVDD